MKDKMENMIEWLSKRETKGNKDDLENKEVYTVTNGPEKNKTSESSPLVFISHDSRDSELAEAFSKLLKSVSAGMLKSFRSSDRHGTEGIQYGDEWYKRLMEKLKDASDVVCLFTKRSLNRPWILYEAGVAKGTLDTPVHGVALGVPLSQVSTGPFYQFQNCQDDEDGLTGLVMQLIRRIPSAEPDPEAIQLQVGNFRENVSSILANIDEREEPGTESQAETESSAAKLFEEVKVMMRDLPSNVEEKLSSGIGPVKNRKFSRFHPMVFEEIMRIFDKYSDPSFGLLVASSLFRDNIPWIYELGMDAYRAFRTPREKEAVLRLKNALEIMKHGPMIDLFFDMNSKEGYLMIRDLSRSLDYFIKSCIPSEEEEQEESV